MKSKNLLSRELELFYRDIQPKREQTAKKEKMIRQTDLEFRQNMIKKLNKKYNIEMFSGRVHGGKAYTAKQKNIEFKKLLFGVSNCVRQVLLNVSIQENYYAWL